MSTHAAPRGLQNPGLSGGHGFWLACAVLAWVLIYLAPISSFDIWWHLDSGRWMLAHRAVLLEEVRSAVDAGAPWTNFSWAFQVLVALVHEWGGPWGLVVLKAALWVAILLLSGRVAVGLGDQRLAAWLIILLLAGFTLPSYMVLRPHLLAALCLMLAVWLLQRPWNRRAALYWALLLLVWANVHASVVVGGAALALHVLSDSLRQGGGIPLLLRRGLTLLPFALIPFLTPNGLDLITVLLEHAGGDLAKAYILEWGAAPLRPSVFLVAALALGGFVRQWRRCSYGEVFLFLFFLWFALENHRFQFELLLTAIRPATAGLAAMLAVSTERGAAGRTAWLGVLAALLAVYYYGDVVSQSAKRWHAMPVKQAIYPTTGGRLLLAAAEDMGRPVRVLNHYEFGGYLEWLGDGALSPFIDGRTPTIYSDRRLMENVLATGKRDLRRGIAREFAMDAILMRRKAGLSFPLDDPDWWLVGFDEVSQLYLRKDLCEELGIQRLDFEPGRLVAPGDTDARNRQLAALQRLVALDPGNFVAWMHLGVTYGTDAATRAQAVAALRQATALRPRHALGHLLLAQQLLAAGTPEDAVYGVLEDVLETAGSGLNVRRLQELSELLLQLHRPQQVLAVLAAKDREQMYLLDAHYLTWIHRATAHAALGDSGQARFALDLARLLVPDDDAGGMKSIDAVQTLIRQTD